MYAVKNNGTQATEQIVSPAQRIAGGLGLLGGLGLTALGAMHFPLAFRMATLPAFAQLSRPASDFLILLCFCVGLLLLLVGGLSLHFSRRLTHGDNTARGGFLTVAVALVGRTVLDVLYPLTILGETGSVLQYVLFTGIGFVLPAFLAGNARKVPNAPPLPR